MEIEGYVLIGVLKGIEADDHRIGVIVEVERFLIAFGKCFQYFRIVYSWLSECQFSFVQYTGSTDAYRIDIRFPFQFDIKQVLEIGEAVLGFDDCGLFFDSSLINQSVDNPFLVVFTDDNENSELFLIVENVY